MFKKTMTNFGEDDMRQNKLDYLLLSKQVDALCSQVKDFNLPNESEAAEAKQ